MTLEKLRQARQIIDASGRDSFRSRWWGWSANIREIGKKVRISFVAGSAIFGKPDYKTVIDEMRAELAKVGAQNA
jgi:ribulose-phosphate 3-epimerase